MESEPTVTQAAAPKRHRIQVTVTAPEDIKNVIGQNVFLINTAATTEEIEEIVQKLPKEFLDKILLAMGKSMENGTS